MFILEAIPAVLLAFVVLKYMTDRPGEATWLSPDEREWLEKNCTPNACAWRARGGWASLQVLTDRRVLALSMIYLFSVTAGYGIVFFLPVILAPLGHSNFVTGVLTAIPYARAWRVCCCGGTRRTAAASGAGT